MAIVGFVVATAWIYIMAVELVHALQVCSCVLQCVAVCCNVLQCVAVCCRVVLCVLQHGRRACARAAGMFMCVAVCCSVLQCVSL